MPDELDHEVIDSPQALFRHLYEAHGVIEALDLDQDTAPLQFWLRRHAELERAATRATAAERRPAHAEEVRTATTEEVRTARAAAATATRVAANHAGSAGPRGAASPGGQPASAAGSGPKFRPFADPVVEALAAALVARGLDERRVRRGFSTFTGADRRHGEDAVRATFVVPLLDAVAAHLTGNAQQRTPWPPPTWTATRAPAGDTSPARTPAPPEPAPTEQKAPAAPPPPPAAGAAPRAGDESLIAQPLAAPAAGPAPDADFMAIADVLQERRRTRRSGRRGGGASKPAATAAAATAPPRAPDDDVMALADALQHRRARGRR